MPKHTAALIQAATSLYYHVRLGSQHLPTYPEIYLFHVGDRFGDYSYYDFLPFRKEVFLPAAKPCLLLEEINDRAITCLAVPASPPIDPQFDWQELNPALERIRLGFGYSASGLMEDGDLEISLDAALDEHTDHVVDPQLALDGWDPVKTIGTPRQVTGDGVSRRAWLKRVEERMFETSSTDRSRAARNYAALRHEGRVTQRFARLTPVETLAALWAAASPNV